MGEENSIEIKKEDLDFDGNLFTFKNPKTKEKKEISVKNMGDVSYAGGGARLEAEASWGGKYSPPPFMATAVKIKIDKITGKVELLDFVSEVDSGTPINPNLVRVQTEGGNTSRDWNGTI